MSFSKRLLKVLAFALVASLLWCDAGYVFYAAEPAYAAAKKKAKKKKATKKSSSNSVSTGDSIIDQIIRDTKANFKEATYKWRGKTIYFDGTLIDASSDFYKGNPALLLKKTGTGDVVFAFIFNNLNSLQTISSLASSQMDIGQKMRLKGDIATSVCNEDGSVVRVFCVNSDFAGNQQVYRCSKCGQTYTKVTDGVGLLDMMAAGAKCQYGGKHNWQRVN